MSETKTKLAYLLKVKGVTGVEKHVLDLCRGLSDEFDIHVLIMEKKDFPQDEYRQDLKNLGISVQRFFLQKTFSLKTAFAVRHHLKKNQIRILHTHLMAADLVGAFIKRTLRSISWISTIHNIHSFLAMKNLVRTIYKQALKPVDQVIFPTQFLKVQLQDFVVPEKTYVISHGVADKRSLPDLSQNLSPIHILFVGRLIPLKGTEDLIKAFSLLCAGRSDLVLDIVGDGPERGRLQKIAADLRVSEFVKFHGYQKNVDVFFSQARIFVLSSHTEGLPLSLLEAMSFGKAIVATEITSIPECVTDGESALLVKPHDVFQMSLALKKLVNDITLAQRLGQSARRIFEEKFTVQKMIERYRIQYRMCS